jgi:uncharacterized protein
MKRQTLAILALVIFLVGCQPAPSQTALPTVQMKLGTKTYTLEIAATPDTREHGLMRRDSMPADHGMIFVFAKSERMGFWMKNTRIPLDIVYIDEHGKVDSVKPMQPYVEKSVWSAGSVKWAIELNQGQAAVAGIKAGDVVEIPESAKNTSQ